MLPVLPALQPRPGLSLGRLRTVHASLKPVRDLNEAAIAAGYLRSRSVLGLDALMDRYEPGARVPAVLVSANDHDQVFLVDPGVLARSRELCTLLLDEALPKAMHNSPVKLARLEEAGVEVRGYVDLMANAGWGTALAAIAAHHGIALPAAVTADEVAGAISTGSVPALFERAGRHARALVDLLPSQLEVTRAYGLPDNWYELQRRARATLGGTEVMWELPEGSRRYPRITIRLGTPAAASVRAVRPQPATPVTQRTVRARRNAAAPAEPVGA